MKRITQYIGDTVYQYFKLNGEVILEVKDPNFSTAIDENVIIEGVTYCVDTITVDIVGGKEIIELKSF